MNEAFEEKFWFRISRLNVFVVVGTTVLVLTVGTMALVIFTSLREFIPGYTRDEIVQLAYQNQSKIDSLETLVGAQEKYLFAMNLAISGEIPIEKVENIDSASIQNYANILNKRSKEDDLLREQIEKGEKFNLTQQPNQSAKRVGTVFNTQSSSKMLFYVPLEGTIVADFNAANKHFGIDITGKKNDAIKAVQNGTVVSSEWTTEGEYVIAIQHENNMLSIYKYNSAVLKRVGDYVKAGEPVAFIGNSKKIYKGPVSHFELWHNGAPVNPKDYIAF